MNKSNHLGNPWLHILTKLTLSLHDSGSRRMDLSTSQKTRHWSAADPWESLVILRVLDQTGEGTSAFGWFGFLGSAQTFTQNPPLESLQELAWCSAVAVLRGLTTCLWPCVLKWICPSTFSAVPVNTVITMSVSTESPWTPGVRGSERLQMIPGSLCFISHLEEKGKEAHNLTGPCFPFKPKLP